jgi:hypothetical protein
MDNKPILWMRDGNKIREQFMCPVTYYVSCATVHLWAKGRKKSNERAQKTSKFNLKQHVIWWSMIDYCLTLTLLTWKIWWAPNNASRWQMGFNSAFSVK